MGMFDNVGNARAAADGGNYIRAGHYFMRIERVKVNENPASGAGALVAIEMTTIDALPDGDIELDENFQPKSKDLWHSPGQAVSHLLLKKHQSFDSNFKAFVMNVGDIAEAEVTPEVCAEVCDGIFEGILVEVRARTVKTRANKPFTRVSYVREVPPAEIKERVAAEKLDIVFGPDGIDKVIEEFEAAAE